jgi:hypothetical protein
MNKMIDKDKVVAEIESYINGFCDRNGYLEDAETNGIAYETLCDLKDSIDNLEVKEVIAEQECTCNEALNRIIGGNWNLLCPVNKLGLKTGDKVKVIIEAQKGE